MITGELFGGTVHWDQLPVYLAAELFGAVAAGVCYVALNTHRETVTPTPAANQDVEPATAEGALS
ncbi:hypothetical protein GR925_01755 [Streptomyces sp. HUCO-GS316]|uniref:hypothetical protein n=1 Tax=Streptomyces sp. HUCO-GS316 TaxID=2692198 RepID=UPI001368FA67|nr:hypothetical protein [Streptomyces sp. HUCO-GS316]MXM62205.1 hypothetical protein [Streptomyces sp. HUCO-GS316]